MGKIIMLVSVLMAESKVAFARPSMGDAYEGSGGGFWIFVLPFIIYKAFNKYGAGLGIVTALAIVLIVFNFPGVLVFIDFVAAVAFVGGLLANVFLK